jgi:hypothetical protein
VGADVRESTHIVDLAYLRRHAFGQQAAQEQVAARQVLKVQQTSKHALIMWPFWPQDYPTRTIDGFLKNWN